MATHQRAPRARSERAGWNGHRHQLIHPEHSPRSMSMDIKRAGTKPSVKGPADWFTGTVRIDPLFEAPRSGARRRAPRHLRARSRVPPGTPIRSARR